MKKSVSTILTFIVVVGIAFGQEKLNIEKEKEAIVALITEETNAYHDKDFERFSNCYVQNETNIRLLSGEGEKMSYTLGWNEVGSGFKERFEKNPNPTPNNEVKKIVVIKVYNKSAWVVFEEENFSEKGESNGKGIGTNFLEKVDGKWKIAYLSRVHY